MDKRRIGRRVRGFRKLKGYTQQEFAEELDVSIAVLGSLERGTRKPTKELMEQIAHTLAITTDELQESDNQ
ncbi:helix-turn-helix domain-containing protein [Virgibacillus xinjiangensis]|uniref:Helix-turn-helix domain-containing protein n=1 Tax=Virgibacillus xinjiangensis TaxID=393090 RepID=A0ABV7CWW6_9BACI